MSNRNSVFAGYPWTRKCNVCAHTPNKYLLYEWVHGQKDLQRRRKDAGVRGERSSCWLPGSWFGFWFLILPRPKVLPWVPGNLISLIKRRFYFCLHGFLLCATQGPPTPHRSPGWACRLSPCPSWVPWSHLWLACSPVSHGLTRSGLGLLFLFFLVLWACNIILS